MKIEELKQEYDIVCSEYIKKFVKKHGYQFNFWVANDVGGIACFIDQYFFNFSDIRYDLDKKCPKGMIFKWQDYCIENDMQISFFTYHLGYRIKEK
jgi:hypothetical protein